MDAFVFTGGTICSRSVVSHSQKEAVDFCHLCSDLHSWRSEAALQQLPRCRVQNATTSSFVAKKDSAIETALLTHYDQRRFCVNCKSSACVCWCGNGNSCSLLQHLWLFGEKGEDYNKSQTNSTYHNPNFGKELLFKTHLNQNASKPASITIILLLNTRRWNVLRVYADLTSSRQFQNSWCSRFCKEQGISTILSRSSIKSTQVKLFMCNKSRKNIAIKFS